MLNEPVAARLVQASWGWASAPNAMLAVRMGLAAARAAAQVPGMADAAQGLTVHPQPWGAPHGMSTPAHLPGGHSFDERAAASSPSGASSALEASAIQA